jgi:Cof subfamily protein (haloacid dehalogenase superfamily)
MSDVDSPNRPLRLVAIDLDGTLLTDTKQVSRRTVDALCGLPQQGVKVVIASARPPRSVRAVYEMLKLDTWQINYNGALIWDEGDKRPVFHLPLPGSLARRIVEESRDLFDEVEVGYEVLDNWFTDRADEDFGTETIKRVSSREVVPLEDFIDMEPTKLQLLGEPRMIARLEPWLGERFGEEVSIFRLQEHHLQIMHKSVTKAAALQRVGKHYGIDMEQVMAIGDAPNDVAMLQVAGVAIAMDNAHALVKRVADWVAPSNNDHGVCAALERYGLCESRD